MKPLDAGILGSCITIILIAGLAALDLSVLHWFSAASSSRDSVLIATPVTTETREPPTTVPEPEFTLSDSVRAGDATVTFYSYQAPVVPENPASVAGPGNLLALVDVEGCIDKDASEGMDYNLFSFALQLPDNTRWEPHHSRFQPEFGVAAVLPGDCIRGLIPFEIPVAAKPAFLIFDGIGPGSTRVVIKWTIP